MTTPARISWHGQEMAGVTEIVKIGIGRRGPSVETTVEVPAFDEPELRQVIAMAKAIHLFDVAARWAPDSFLLMVAGLYNKHGGTTALGVPRSKVMSWPIWLLSFRNSASVASLRLRGTCLSSAQFSMTAAKLIEASNIVAGAVTR